MEDYAQQFIEFGKVHADQEALAAVQQQPDLRAFVQPVLEQLTLALRHFQSARFSDVTVVGKAFPRDFMPGTACPCNKERAAKLHASLKIVLCDRELLFGGVQGLQLDDRYNQKVASEVKLLVLASFICSGLPGGSERLYQDVLQVQVDVKLEELQECQKLYEQFFPRHDLKLLEGMMLLYRHISGNPARHGAEVSARASMLYEELRDKCAQGDDAHQNLLHLDGKGESQQPSSDGCTTARMTAVDSIVHTGITGAFGLKVAVHDRPATDEGMMDESA